MLLEVGGTGLMHPEISGKAAGSKSIAQALMWLGGMAVSSFSLKSTGSYIGSSIQQQDSDQCQKWRADIMGPQQVWYYEVRYVQCGSIS